MIRQSFPEIQDQPYPLQAQNPLQGMDDVAIFNKNQKPSIISDNAK